MSLDGFFIVHRQALESWVWDLPASQFKVTATLLALANWKAGQTMSGGRVIKVERGEVMTSLGKLAEKSRESIQTCRTTIKNLEAAGFLTNKPTNKFRILSIKNYDTYQSPPRTEQQAEQQGLNKQPTSNQQATNNDRTKKQGNKKNKRSLGGFAPEVIEIADRVLGRLNDRLRELGDARQYPTCKTYVAPIASLLASGASEEDLRLVVWHRANEWGDPPGEGQKDMRPYLRPETLFRPSKFAGYLVSAKADPAAQAAIRAAREGSNGDRSQGDLFTGGNGETKTGSRARGAGDGLAKASSLLGSKAN